ncbi:MAG: High-affinity branched-chain amino acid transport system permease protein LivH [Fimbriimonadaceae bacterium]|nr:High-affinity branched-chain amino acid transport system permease protein LivH [Fimbriimonadaceae bacterium]
MHLAESLLAGLNFSTLPSQLVNGLLLGAIYALIALGYTMVYGVLRLINFAHGEVYMLGAYSALFTSWYLGFESGKTNNLTTSPLNLIVMLLAAMVICALVGVVIELFAYRPMRNQPRIASLITAIGVSLFLQYGGALFLPNDPPRAINEQINPYRGSMSVTLKDAAKEVTAPLAAAKVELAEADSKYADQLKNEADQFNLSPAGVELRDKKFVAERKVNELQGKANAQSVSLTVPKGQLIMLGASVVLMLLLRQLVLKTATGRAMRAVSHDFDSASLMGVNVGRVIVITFVIGSALAGAAAMMTATFMGTPVSARYGVLPGIKAFVAAVLGGIGNIPGAVLGGILMGVAETVVIWSGYGGYKDAVAFVILIGVLLFKPTGLMGSAKMEKV